MQQVGFIGLAVMGQALVRNMLNHGLKVVVYNRTKSVTDEFIKTYAHENLIPVYSYAELAQNLPGPRHIFLMISAGPAVDAVLAELTPNLSIGDKVIDAGNSWYKDSQRRAEVLAPQGIEFIDLGVSGGALGALNGPSMMLGGLAPDVLPLLQPLAAKDFAAGTTVGYFAGKGAGHFVKMIHNGIEYAIMQLIAEIYQSMKLAGQTNQQISEVFFKWSQQERSYLLLCASEVLASKTEDRTQDLVDLIIDVAGQKGTGAWSLMTAAELGVAMGTVGAALEVRQVSALRELRQSLSGGQAINPLTTELPQDDLLTLFNLGCLVALQQGLAVIAQGAILHKWTVDLAECCRIWQGGCIIRMELLQKVAQTVQTNDTNVIWQSELGQSTIAQVSSTNVLVKQMQDLGVATAVSSAAINYLKLITSATLPTNLLQGMRDNFGQHTYTRVDKPGQFTGGWEKLG